MTGEGCTPKSIECKQVTVSGGKCPRKTTDYFVQNPLPFIPFPSQSRGASLARSSRDSRASNVLELADRRFGRCFKSAFGAPEVPSKYPEDSPGEWTKRPRVGKVRDGCPNACGDLGGLPGVGRTYGPVVGILLEVRGHIVWRLVRRLLVRGARRMYRESR